MSTTRFYERLFGKPSGSCTCVIDGTPVFTTSEWDALHEFDAVNGVEPTRTIARRIVAAHGIDHNHPIVDEISHAIEDAYALGARRGPYERRAISSR